MTNNTEYLNIHRAELDEIAGVTVTLTEAFMNGDYADWLVPDPREREKIYPDYFRIFAEFFVSQGQVDTSHDMTAVAVWWPVGAGLNIDIPDYVPRLAKITGTNFDRFMALDNTQHANHPIDSPHQYLVYLAVQPEHQGKGRGATLLKHGLERFDKFQAPVYLEATGLRNRLLYTAHGFENRPELRIPNGPKIYPMWRRPRTQEVA